MCVAVRGNVPDHIVKSLPRASARGSSMVTMRPGRAFWAEIRPRDRVTARLAMASPRPPPPARLRSPSTRKNGSNQLLEQLGMLVQQFEEIHHGR